MRASLIAALLAAAPTADAEAVGARTVRLETVFGGQLMFQAKVAGVSRLFLFDTGGGATVIAPSLATQIGCKPWGQVTGFRMRGQRLDLRRCDNFRMKIAGAALSAPTAAVYDILDGAPKDAPHIGGSVGLDMFKGKIVTLDVGHKALTIESSSSLKRRVRHARELTARFERDLQGLALEPLIAVQTPKGRVWLEIDSGSDGSVIANRPVAEALGVDGANTGSQNFKLKLVGGPEIDTPGHIEDLIRDGNIGVRVLQHWIVTIDTARERIWIAPSGL